MDVKEIRELSEASLQDKLTELYKESFNLRFQHASAQLENTARVRQVKKSIARIKTVLGERKIEQGI